MTDQMMRAIQLRGQMPQAERQAEARTAVERVAALVKGDDEADFDHADGILVSTVHAGVRPTELFLAIVEQALKEP